MHASFDSTSRTVEALLGVIDGLHAVQHVAEANGHCGNVAIAVDRLAFGVVLGGNYLRGIWRMGLRDRSAIRNAMLQVSSRDVCPTRPMATVVRCKTATS